MQTISKDSAEEREYVRPQVKILERHHHKYDGAKCSELVALEKATQTIEAKRGLLPTVVPPSRGEPE